MHRSSDVKNPASNPRANAKLPIIRPSEVQYLTTSYVYGLVFLNLLLNHSQFVQEMDGDGLVISLQGERYLPQDDERSRWRPCFTAPGIVDEAIRNICTLFEQFPDAKSYSLGVNDGRVTVTVIDVY